VDPRRGAIAVSLFVLALGSAACRGGGDAPSPSAATGATSVTRTAAATAVGALCRMGAAEDTASAKATFYDDAHQTLHAIARAADANEVGSDAELLITMQRVEAELEQPSLPPAYPDDVRALRVATERALEGIDLDVPGC
jgi:hypothetical protein